MSAADPSRPPAAAAGATAPNWAHPARHAAFNAWLARVAAMHGLLPASLRVASADASFRRYFRIDCADGASRIVMDAPPAQENCAPFVQVAGLMRDAGLNVPRILDWDETGGFMLMTDLGARTMMEVIERDHPEAFGWAKPGTSSHSKARKAASAMIAKIPLPLSRHIAAVFKPRASDAGRAA